MRKIIARENEAINPTSMLSFYSKLCERHNYVSAEELITKRGIVNIMGELFCEEIETSDLISSELYKSFDTVMQTGRENNDFIFVYRFGENFAVQIDKNYGHIYVRKLIPYDSVLSNILPWVYVGVGKHIGDMWTDSEEEILKNLHELTTIDFLREYKGV